MTYGATLNIVFYPQAFDIERARGEDPFAPDMEIWNGTHELRRRFFYKDKWVCVD
jgi:hypothetical protein